jgi:hypothetical protein
MGGRAIVTGSGKAAIALVLRYLKSEGVIAAKTDEVLMPQWLGYWVYNQVNEFARPVFSVGKTPKVIMPYHQYGFPQQMDEIKEYARSVGAVVIEDCAHALGMGCEPEPDNRDFRIFSFSKFFFCFALGAALGGGESFKRFACEQIDGASRNITRFNNFVKYFHEMSLSGRIAQSDFLDNLLSMSYALYGRGLKPAPSAVRLMETKVDAEIECRRRRYAYFRDRFRAQEVERYLGTGDVSPYVIPLLLPIEKLLPLSVSLLEAGFKTGVYHFDTNRNLLRPRFESVVWLLLHKGMSDTDFERQLQIVEKGV